MAGCAAIGLEPHCPLFARVELAMRATFLSGILGPVQSGGTFTRVRPKSRIEREL